jgi:hypothetical protein
LSSCLNVQDGCAGFLEEPVFHGFIFQAVPLGSPAIAELQLEYMDDGSLLADSKQAPDEELESSRLEISAVFVLSRGSMLHRLLAAYLSGWQDRLTDVTTEAMHAILPWKAHA